jgi:4-alpha-glucanotransferase
MTLVLRSKSTPLHQLARRLGIIDAYLDQTGRETRDTTDETRRALLAAMGFDASTDSAAADALETLREEARHEHIERARVIALSELPRDKLSVRPPASRTHDGRGHLQIHLETGGTLEREGAWSGRRTFAIPMPHDLPLGYHAIRLALHAGRREWLDEQTLIVVPRACVLPDEVIGGDRVFGLTVNLYTLRSAANWGVGDFTDLAALADWAGGTGAEFIGVNPLHAILDRGSDVSPYSPISRLFRNPIYVDVTRVPELAMAPAVRERLGAPELLSEIDALRDSPTVAYEQVMAVKGIALDALHQVFAERVRGSGDQRDRDYTRYVAAHEPQLSRYALWMAIGERQRSFDWRTWPAGLRDYTTDVAQAAARELAGRVEFHRWLQFETDRQLGAAAGHARAAGMRIGLYQDLAIGVSPAGADAWMYPDLLVHGVSIGAPPDPYAAEGQNWGLPPLDPRALRRTGYRYFVECVRSAFGHAGALRIDHVMGLFRLFWIPEGHSGTAGAYVRYPAHDLLGILALESARHRGVVVGEDLGTVPRGVPEALERWGVLSSKVLLFERDRRRRFRPAASYPSLALATANTHDLPTITGFWDERDIDLRARVGLIDNDEAVERARRERNDERTALVERLATERILPAPKAPPSPADLRGAVHAFLCRTPSRLVGLALDDLAGEVEPVNVPGVGPDKHSSWTRKMRRPLEIIMASDDVRAALRCEGRGRAAASRLQD